MEYRRRKSTRRRTESAGGGLRAFILLLIFGATAYLILGTGLGKRMKEGYAMSLLDSCMGRSGSASANNEVIGTSNPLVNATLQAPSITAAPTGETVEISMPAIDVYMIQMGFYKTETECAPAAAELKAMGAAGYVYNDNGDLRLIAAAFSDEASAQSVKERVSAEGHDCIVYHIARNGVDLLITADAEKMLPIRTAFTLAEDAITQLDELSIDFDAESRSVEYGLEVLSELRTNVDNAMTGIADSAEQSEMLKLVLTYYSELDSYIKQASANSADRVSFASSLKELRIRSALRYALLLQEIGG